MLFKLNLLYKKIEEDVIQKIIFDRDFILNDFDTTQYKNVFQEFFPNLSNEEILKLLLLIKLVSNKSVEDLHKVEIVSSGTSIFDLPIRETVAVIRELLLDATNHIFLSGYAISSYFDNFESILKNKANQGVEIEIYIESNNSKNIKNVLKYLNVENMKVYKYKSPHIHSALHAKTIVVDYKKAFITSANLSYSGMINNIEIGALIEGRQVENIIKIFKNLNKQGLFELIN